MQIKYLNLTSFGKFKNKEIAFGEGLNVIYGANESGKSTIQSFIDGMFFGFNRRKTKNGDGYNRFDPWATPSEFSGSMLVNFGGSDYLFDRNFYTKDKNDYVIDVKEGKSYQVDEFLAGRWNGSFTETIFKNTAQIHQLQAQTDDELAAQVQNYIANISNSKSAEVDVAAAKQHLKDEKKAFLDEIETLHVEEYEEKRNKLADDLEQLRNLEKNFSENSDKIKGLEVDYRTGNMSAGAELVSQFDLIRQKYEQLNDVRKEIFGLKKKADEQIANSHNAAGVEVKTSSELSNMIADLDACDKEREAVEHDRYEKEGKLHHSRYVASAFAIISVIMMLVAGAINAWDYLYNDKEVHIAYLAVFGVTVLLSLICFVLSMVRASILKKFKRECRMRNDMISDKVSKILEKSGTTCKSKSELISVMQNRMAEEVTEKGLKDQLKTYNDQIDARMLKLASLTCDVISYGSQYGMNNKIKDEVTDVFLRDMSSPVNIAAILIDGKQDGATYDIEKETILPTKLWMEHLTEKVNGVKEKVSARDDEYRINKEKLSNQSAILREKIDALSDTENNLHDLEKSWKAASARKEECEANVKAIDNAAEIINNLNVIIHDSIGKTFNDNISEIAGKLMGIKKYDVIMDENMNLSVVTPFGIKPVSSLSHGTIDQIYLAARFALTDVFYDPNEDTVPFIIDDGFITSDDARVVSALRYLAASNRQVILFTSMLRDKRVLDMAGVKYDFVEI